MSSSRLSLPISNIDCGLLETPKSVAWQEEIRLGDEARKIQGYTAEGSLGGPYTETKLPPGLMFKEYKKGFPGIIWVPESTLATSVAASTSAPLPTSVTGATLVPTTAAPTSAASNAHESESTEEASGYCSKCGFSLVHCAGNLCVVSKELHSK